MTKFDAEWLAQYERKLRHPPSSDSLTMILPVPPTVNAMFANVPGKGRVKTEAYRTWRVLATAAITEQIGSATITGRYRATLHISSGADIDGVIKGPIDILVSMGVTDDDKHMVELHVYRDAGPRGLKITVERIG